MDFTFFTYNWEKILIVAIALHTFLKALRDALDKTPETDDNIFERVVTVIGKVINYIVAGKRIK